jgi:hypothetical protein
MLSFLVESGCYAIIFHANAANSMSIYPDTGVRVVKPDTDGQVHLDHSMIVAPTVVPRWPLLLFLLFCTRCI